MNNTQNVSNSSLSLNDIISAFHKSQFAAEFIMIFIISFIMIATTLYFIYEIKDFATIAKNAKQITPTVDYANYSVDKQPIYITGIVKSDGSIIGDELFLLPDKYIVVKRKVEMYSWVEEETRVTRLSYKDSTKIEETIY